MKKIKLLCLFLFLNSILTAQEWSPSGAVWVYAKANMSDIQDFDYLSYIGDTTINSISTKILEYKRISIQKSPNGDIINTWKVVKGHEYLYESNDIVYWFWNSTFVPLYYFNTQINDSWKIHRDHSIQHPCNPSIETDSVVVINKDTINFNGVAQILTSLSSVNNNWELGSIIEGIGAQDGPFPKPKSTQSCPIIDYNAGIGGYLICYYDSLRGFVDHSGACGSIITSTNRVTIDENQYSLNVYPNPFTNTIMLNISESNQDFSNVHVTIYNVVGQIVFNEILQGDNINLEHLTSGMYILSVKVSDKTIINEKIIKY